MALYHTYRPQQFADVVGQEHIVTTITNQISNDKVAHAYLFSGPRGVGKTTMARLLAKAMNGPKKKGSKFEPDNTDPTIIEISEGRSIDVIEIDAASHTGVDNVRENIIENAQFKPTSLPYKVFIIDEVHMLSTSAFNALLKTLEEPPSHVLFILATTELHKLPETIISRCQRFTFKKIPHQTMKDHLTWIAKQEKVTIADEVLDRVINKSDGCVRDAVGLLDQIMATGEKKITSDVASLILPASNAEQTLAFLQSLVTQDAPQALTTLRTLAEDGISIPQFATDLLELERYLLIMATAGKEHSPTTDYSGEVVASLAALTNKISQQELVRLLDLTLRRKQQIPTSPLPELPLEMLAVEWCSGTTPPTIAVSSATNSTPITKNEQLHSTVEKTQEQTPKKPSVVEKVKELVRHTPFTSLDEAAMRWPQFVEQVEAQFPSLSFILKMGELSGVSGNNIQLSVPYSFHRDKLMSHECKKDLEALLETTYGKGVELEVRINTNATPEQPSEELHELAAAFGGEIV